MERSYGEPIYNQFMARSKKYNNIDTAVNLMQAMQIAIENMIQEIQKPVDQELSGSQRKAELQSIKQTAVDAKELIVERERLEQLIRGLKKDGEIKEERDYSGGFAEQYSK
jgi:hypothetical protein